MPFLRLKVRCNAPTRKREGSVTLALIDYGAGNLQSVKNALKAAGAADVVVSGDPEIIAKADRIVLPGVGAFAHCMGSLSAIDGMVAALTERVLQGGVPFLGICVGMQLLADAGVEHGTTQGLGWIGGTVRAIAPSPDIKVPHMGWNDVTLAAPHSVLESGEAYFLHGYHFAAADNAQVLATSSHGSILTAAVGRDNILGVQFHPEKSQAYGIGTLTRFMEWKP
jgi:imidazole glycerol-phosphate synthase subunit HisH